MGIIAFLAVSGLFWQLSAPALAISSVQAGSPDYFTQEKYAEPISVAVAVNNSNHLGTTDDGAFLGMNTPVSGVKKHLAGSVRKVVVTAYSSTPDQTDSTPFIMANGKHVYDGAVAANFLPFGIKVRFPELYGDKIFVVEDRMNERYGEGRMDIWMPTRAEAIRFGARYVTLEIVG